MTRINTNVSSLVAQNRLTQSNQDLNTALTRLSTGLRINTGADDPAGLIASEALRSEITSLQKAVINTKRAGQVISTIDSALGQVSTLLTDIRGLVVEAANTGALSSDEIAANQLQLDSSLEAINRIAQTTTFKGRKLLDGSLGFVTELGAGAAKIENLRVDQANLGATENVDVEINVSSAATKAAFVAADFIDPSTFVPAVAASTTFVIGGETITVTSDNPGVAGNGKTINFAAGGSGTPVEASVDGSGNINVLINLPAISTAQNYVDAINALSGYSAATDGPGTGWISGIPSGVLPFAGGADEIPAVVGGLPEDVVFKLQGSAGSEVFGISAGASLQQVIDQINLVSDSTGVIASEVDDTLVLSSESYGSDAIVDLQVIDQGAGGLFASTRATGTDIVATVNGTTASGDGNTISINTSSLDLTATLAAGQTGTSAFAVTGGGAKFQLGTDVVGIQQARIGIDSVNTGRLGGTVGRLYEIGSGQSASLTNDIARAADIVTQAIDQVTGLRGRLGAFQATTLQSNEISLNTTVANLLEAESSIRDADFAVESAKLTRAQILVQSGTNVLSLANQNPQNVLALLR